VIIGVAYKDLADLFAGSGVHPGLQGGQFEIVELVHVVVFVVQRCPAFDAGVIHLFGQ
jgi:hypothetical protein